MTCRRARRVVVAWMPLALAALLGALPARVARAQDEGKAAYAARVVPDRLLRSWDPITLFFGGEVGPGAGPEDAPERFVRLEPEHEGAWRWLDARTLQFRPAEPWPPLGRVAVRAGGRVVRLATLLSAPRLVEPAEDARAPGAVEWIRLAFDERLDAETLRSMLSIELRPLPGVDARGARVLGAEDFTVRALDRRSASEPAEFLVEPERPIPSGVRAILRFRLAADELADGASIELGFTTADAFRVARFGCGGQSLPIGAGGVRAGREQPLRCGGGATPYVELTAEPGSERAPVTAVEARNLVRFEPAVEGFDVSVSGDYLMLAGDFRPETLYRVTLVPTALADAAGRPLEMAQESELFLVFERREAFLRPRAAQGIVERHGPRRLPLEGRGDERVDLRIHRVEPLDRNFWPFPDEPVELDESRRPPGPGEEPDDWGDSAADLDPGSLAARLAALGSPPVSTIVPLPLARAGRSASFGLDLGPHLDRIAGAGAAGHYMVGLRRIGRDATRLWTRVQVTDLSLATLEEPRAVVFTVTSLATAQPVAEAEIALEGPVRGTATSAAEFRWGTVATLRTDAAGRARWQVPESGTVGQRIRRLVVRRGDDVLALDVERPPERFHDGQWFQPYGEWLGWTRSALGGRGPRPETLAHLFPDRPVYRPEETVHLKGYLRSRQRGEFRIWREAVTLVVTGPGELVWRFPLRPSEHGSFHHAFAGEGLPTGPYSAHVEDGRGQHFGAASFRLEAYRLPKFEVVLSAPERVPLDREFQVALTATYFAGGRVGGRPVDWRVTQFPATWAPKARAGFLYSSDGRYSRTARFESTPRLERRETTDDDGGARLVLNPTLEPTAQPRSYVVEATVTGEDDQTVSSSRRILALPPFVVGLKAPRFLPEAREIPVEVLVAGADGELVAGHRLTVRLVHRQWHSVLRASDFSDGVARYLTDVVDEPVAERTVTSGAEPVPVVFPVAEAGVYLVEVEASDRLGRSQVVTADLYAGGAGAVAWGKPAAGTFTVSPDKARYAPGETANLVLQSPFQSARALAVIEAPDANRYEWLPVEGGQATLPVTLAAGHAPRLPVHVVLFRGRLAGVEPRGGAVDLGKPSTLATTVWLEVEPRGHRVQVALEAPSRARPGETVEITVRLTDPDGAPLAGEATLWLVDAAVLSLGQEARLDPIPDFLRPAASWLDVRDTRNLAFGFLPFAENPGGDGAEAEEADLLTRTTVRKNFRPVPYYEPALAVGPDGVARVRVALPDDLTVFKLRAKAVAGAGRFGFGVGELAVRLPVIAQPALPRFVRPGDRFTGAAIGRVVEGEGGAARAQIAVEGAELAGAPTRELELAPNRPERIEFQVSVPQPPLDARGQPSRREVVFRAGVERLSDRAADAFEVRLPIADDRERVAARRLVTLAPGERLDLPAVGAEARPGSVRRELFVSGEPALVRMAAALDFQRDYPFGCTEQRVSVAASELALADFRAALGADPATDAELRERTDRSTRAVASTLAWLAEVRADDGRIPFWPGGRGSVWLTAWAGRFLAAARAAGQPVDAQLVASTTRALERALRSDSTGLVDGAEWSERAAALLALTLLGKGDAAYAAELARKAETLDAEAAAQVLRALAEVPGSEAARRELAERLWSDLVFRLDRGREIFGGVERASMPSAAEILPGEARTLAEIVRALAPRDDARAARFPLLVDGLIQLGGDDGWGDVNANAAALGALATLVRPPFAGAGTHRIEAGPALAAEPIELGPARPAAALAAGAAAAAAPVGLVHASGSGPLVVRAETSWIPAADGGREEPSAAGFVVGREWQRVSPAGEILERLPIERAGERLALSVGDLIEERVQVVNPEERHYVAVVVPLAAGFEPLNAALETAPPEAAPAGRETRRPDFVEHLDDRMTFYFDRLPAGTFDLFFRVRATTAGEFVQPAARAEGMYDASVRGNSAGARVEVRPAASSTPGPSGSR